MKKLGIDHGPSASQIVPVIVGEPQAALKLGSVLREAGIWATPIRPPTVPEGTARLRIAFNAAHERADLERLISAISAWHILENSG